jgi:hypothetical protein
MSPYSAQAIPNSVVPNGHILGSMFTESKPVIGRHFAYAFASNGWKKDSICIGGSAPQSEASNQNVRCEPHLGFGDCRGHGSQRAMSRRLQLHCPENVVNRLDGLWLGNSQLGREELCSAQRKIEKNHPVLYEEVQYVYQNR